MTDSTPNRRSTPDPPEPTLRLRPTDVASRRFEEETIVLDMRTSTYLSANSAATALWHELQHGTTKDRLVQVLLDAFEVDAEQAAADVDAFVADCRARGLLDESDSATS